MQRGEVYWVDFEPTVGSEIRKIRPSVVVSNNSANKTSPIIQVLPMTSSADKIYSGEAFILFAGKKTKVLANQIRSVSKQRIKNKMGQLNERDMLLIDNAIKIQLALT